ncbi:iron complex outermembrane receptor protein [Arcticibacter tournemirensis]|uniref:TonB-dependent receptor n=1 Tax=Arcticibacter tournemirensis TaxID=699437 RepID=A0A5M9HLE3_9SPHI|nr:TonB-dependent receptor [Arcticibacter tournemirensis]KAA8486281.1 TonB-dependent receptor [Arcticibacter tournemirensis]TQM52088.1 iron complex outermembrane receptor protein [Arcticibacter tournemirensis]
MQVKKILLLGALCACWSIDNTMAGLKTSGINSKAYEESLPENEQHYGTIRGRITTADGSIAAYVSVVLKGTKFGAMSDENGEYQIKRVPEGDYTMIVSAVGLSPREKQIHVSGKGTVIADFSLKENRAELEVVQIKGHRNKFKTDKVSPSLRLQSPLIEIPQNIRVVTDKLIADQLVFDIVDGVTRNVAGTVRTGHWDAQYANISTRGTTIPAFRNGMNQKMPWGPLADDAATIERIEFIKGPSGFMMANGEPGGIYNVVTKKPTGENRSSVSFSGGGYNLGRAAIDLDGKLSADGRLLFRLNAAAQTKGSYNKYNYTDKYVIAPVVSYQIDSNTLVTAEYTTQHVEAQALGTYGFSPNGFGDTDPSFFIGDPSLDPNKLYDHNATLYFNHKLNNDWKVNAQVAYVRYGLFGGTPWPSQIALNGDMKRYLNISEELAINKNAQVSIMGDLATGPVIHRLMAGVDMGNLKTWGDFGSAQEPDLRLGDNKVFNIYNPEYGIPMDSIPVFDRSRSIQIRSGSSTYLTNLTYTGVYLQDEIRMLDEKLRLTLAGRFTHAVTVGKTNKTHISDNIFSPRVGLSYSVTKDFSAYALYDQSFLPVGGQDFAGDPFKPIRGNNVELGLKKDWFDGKWNTTIAAYKITKKNVLTQDLDPEHRAINPNAQVQVGEIESKGIELDIVGEIVSGLNVVLNYAYTDAIVSKDNNPELVGRHVANSVKHLTNGWLSYRYKKQGSLLDGFGLTGGYQIHLDRYAGTTARPLMLPEYYRFDAGATYEKGKLSVSCLVNNLLDRRLLTQGSYNQLDPKKVTPTNVNYYTYIYEMPRNARLSIAYRFK